MNDGQKGIGSLVLLAFGFGLIAISIRYLSYHYTLYQQLYLSVGVGLLISLFVFPTKSTIKKIRHIPYRDWGIILFRAFVGYVIASALYRESLTLTKISNVVFIQAIPFVGLFGWILFKEKFSLKKFVLLMSAYVGVLIISINDYSSVLTIGKGEIFSFVSTAIFSLSYLSRKWMTDYLNDKEITQILLFVGTLALFAVSVIKGDGLPKVNWEILVLLSIFATGLLNVINIFLINYGFRKVDAVLASNILTLEAIFALILAFIFYRELPTAKELIGGLLILGSVIQMNRLKG